MNQQSFNGQGIGLPGFNFLCLWVFEEAHEITNDKKSTTMTDLNLIRKFILNIQLFSGQFTPY